jgi:Ca-activated chloride channel homolog
MGVRLFACGVVALAIGCGAAGDDRTGLGGNGGTGAGGGNGGSGGGAAVGGSKAPELAEGQDDQTSVGDPAYGGAGSVPPANVSGACANLEQNNQIVDGTIAGSNSTGAALEAKEALKAQTPVAPIPVHVSIQDFLSHYRPDFAPVAGGEPVVHVQMRPSAVSATFELLVAVQAPPPPTEPPRVSLTIVVDNTVSMGDAGLEKAKLALLAIAADLNVGDTVQLLTAQPDAAAVEFSITEPNDPTLKAAVEALVLEPETELPALLDQGYAAAGARYSPGAMNRVLLISDGAAEAGSLPAAIEAAADQATSEIRLTTLGTGPAREHGHRFLRTASRFGRGAYRYLDSAAEASALTGRFHELFGVAMDNVSLSLVIPWYFKVERPFVGAITSGNIQIEPQYVAPGGSMTFVFRLVACGANAHTDFAGEISATFNWTSPGDTTARISEHSVTLPDAVVGQSTPDLDKMLIVAGYAEGLRSGDRKRLTNALALAQENLANPHLAEIADLIGKHPVLANP